MGGGAPAWWDIPFLNSCPKCDKPGDIAFKNSPYPVLSKPKRKKISLSPPKPKYIYIFFSLKKQNFEGIKR